MRRKENFHTVYSCEAAHGKILRKMRYNDVKKGRIVLLDWFKAGSILCIIINHTDLYGRGIPANYVLNCLVVAMAVPVFMMVSGYNMANSYMLNMQNAGGV